MSLEEEKIHFFVRALGEMSYRILIATPTYLAVEKTKTEHISRYNLFVTPEWKQ